MKLNIGIDPGLSGAIGILLNGRYLTHYPMPTQKKKTGKSEVDAKALYALAVKIKLECIAKYKVKEGSIMIERVNANPMQGVSSMFSFGDSFGCARFFAEALFLPVSFANAATWKDHLGLSMPSAKNLTPKEKNERRAKSKEKSIKLALKLFPKFRERCITLKQVEGAAEALLLAHYSYDINAR